MSWIYRTDVTGVKGGTGAPPSTALKPKTYKPAQKITKPKTPKTPKTKAKKTDKDTSDFVYYPPLDQGRPPTPRTRRNTRATRLGRQAGTALSDALDDAMPYILEGDYEGAYQAILQKLKGQMFDTLNRTLGNYGLPPVDDNGPDADYWIRAVKDKSGLDIDDLTVGGLKDYGEKVLWRGLGKSIGIDLDGCKSTDEAIERCLSEIENGNIRVNNILSSAHRKRAEIMKAVKDSGKTLEEYYKACNRRNASEHDR
jgi:hypothetical protein